MLKKLAVFLLVLVVVVVALRILNWFGERTAEQGIHQFSSLEEAQHALRLRDLYLPAYFPDYLEWPPYEVLGQTDPYRLILIHFRNRQSREVVLAIRQAAATGIQPPPTRLDPIRISSEETVQLDQRTALLRQGSCVDSSSCSEISWTEKGQYLSVTLKNGREELLRIASSMGIER